MPRGPLGIYVPVASYILARHRNQVYAVPDVLRYDLLINLAMISVFSITLHYWTDFTNDLFGVRQRFDDTINDVTNILREGLNFCIFAGGSTALALARKWVTAEQKLRESETARIQSELKNLMLRHLLYDNQEREVTLTDEMQFIENYIALMKIRLSQNVDVTFHRQVALPGIKVAPLIFISLIENAFKHGVSPVEPSFVHISITATEHDITCQIENSNHPKSRDDRSGHGIGLSQVQRRLELSYPGRYTWEKGVNKEGNIYTSTIHIQL